VEGVKHCKKCGVIRIGAQCKPCKLAYNAAHYAANREERLAYNAAYYVANRDKLNARCRARRKANPGPVRANNVKRNAQKLQACPEWLTKEHHEEMDQTYKNCPKGSHVDHIIPLQSEVVQGLHVPWNHQYLTAQENRAKSNKCDGTYANEGWRKLK